LKRGDLTVSERVKEIKPIKGVKEREQARKDIIKMLAERNRPIPMYALPGGIQDIKNLENQGLIYIDDMKMVGPKQVSLTEKGKSHVVYEKTESR
jgi:hypothetical protein